MDGHAAALHAAPRVGTLARAQRAQASTRRAVTTSICR